VYYKYDLHYVWEDKSPELKEEIVDFWIEEKAIPQREIAEKRVDEVCLIARDAENKIISVNTVYKQYSPELKNYFYYYRTFVCPRARKYNVIGEMLFNTIDRLEERFAEKIDNETIGIFLEVENKDLKKRFNQAIWPSSNFVYVGTNQKGDHLRVHYFKNALIS